MFSKHFLILRSPSLPVKIGEELSALSEKEALNYIKEILSNRPDVLNSIKQNAPDLSEIIDKHLFDDLTEKSDKVYFTLYKYLIRMSTRCTPFDRLAATAVINPKIQENRPISEAVRKESIFVNPTLYIYGEMFVLQTAGKEKRFDYDEDIHNLLKDTEQGISKKDFIALLAKYDYTENEAEQLLTEWLGTGVLVQPENKPLSFVENTQNAINRFVTADTPAPLKTIKSLRRLLPKRNDNQALGAFQFFFQSHFDDRETPFMEVISKLPTDFFTAYSGIKNAFSTLQSRDIFLIKKIGEAENNIIETTDEEMRAYGLEQVEDFPPSISIVWMQTAAGQTFLKQAGGSSAIQMAARFAEKQKDFEYYCQEIADAEAQMLEGKNAVFAAISFHSDLAFIPNTTFRKHQIVVNQPAFGKEVEFLYLKDISIKPKGDFFTLRHIPTDRILFPCLDNAANPDLWIENPSFYLLALLAMRRNRGTFGFQWGEKFEHFSKLPRVCIENTIVSAAEWRIFPNDIKNEQDLADCLKKQSVPERCLLTENGDQELLLNIHHQWTIDYIFKVLKKNEFIILKEYLGFADTIKDEQGNTCAHEFISPFLNPKYKVSLDKSEPTEYFNTKEEDDCLYFKLYTKPERADIFLSRFLNPFITTQKDILIRWFFVKYEDEKGFHLRVRLFPKKAENKAELFDFFEKNCCHPALKQGLLSDYSVHQYEREHFKYGKYITEIESVFHCDSNLCLKMIPTFTRLELSDFSAHYALSIVEILDIPHSVHYRKSLNPLSAELQNLLNERNCELKKQFAVLITASNKVYFAKQIIHLWLNKLFGKNGYEFEKKILPKIFLKF